VKGKKLMAIGALIDDFADELAMGIINEKRSGSRRKR
jgi:hypothetical protein